VDVKALGQLGQGLLVLHGGQGNLGLKLGTVLPAFGAHRQILLFGSDLQLTPLSKFWGPPLQWKSIMNHLKSPYFIALAIFRQKRDTKLPRKMLWGKKTGTIILSGRLKDLPGKLLNRFDFILP
jgi:hypothetical protein